MTMMTTGLISGGDAAGRGSRGFDRRIPGPLRRDLEFILAVDGFATTPGRPSGVLRSTTAVASSKLALAAALGAVALALLGRPYGVEEDEQPVRATEVSRAVPTLVRLNRGAGEASSGAGGGEQVATQAPGAPAPLSEPASTGEGAAYVRTGPASGPAAPKAADFVEGVNVPRVDAPGIAERPVIALTPPRYEAAVAPPPKLPSVSPRAPSARAAIAASGEGFARPQPRRAAAEDGEAKPEKPSAAARREAVDAMIDLRRQW